MAPPNPAEDQKSVDSAETPRSLPPTDSDSLGRKPDTGITAGDIPPPLAVQENQRMEAALGDAVLRFLRIRKGPRRDEYDPDAVSISTQARV
jgi:hypothetical protein